MSSEELNVKTGSSDYGERLRTKAQYDDHKIRSEMQAKRDHAEIDLFRQERMAGIALQKEFLSAEQRADISSQKELQRTVVLFDKDGNAILMKEQFGTPIRGGLDIRVLNVSLLCHDAEHQDEILALHLMKNDGKDVQLFFDLQHLEPRHLRRQFEKNGISFGFGMKKEDEVRRKLVTSLVQIARRRVIPETFGWYQVGEKWAYAFPKECTWREVLKWL